MAITLLLSSGGLVTLMSGTMLALALETISHDIDTDAEKTQIFLSIFVLAFSFGSMVLSPLAEVFGRRPTWMASSCFYILWNTVAGFSKSSGLLIASRLLSGLGASAEFAVTNPVLSDMWRAEERGTLFAISTFIPLLRPALGPVIGGTVTQTVALRWDLEHMTASERSLRPVILRALSRPLRFLFTQPILQVIATFLAYNFGFLYIVLSTFATLWIERYGQSEWESGLHYFALVIGYTVAAQGGAILMDKLWGCLKKKAGDITAPEYRVPLCYLEPS
ncbi:MFS multidrug transporter [Fusarium agapanthi]|uniref:MFS multidrug transporter n=1 Tax=Fusarium agapanthi TaxID=1803897 RepID=A0A9P5EH65_9HYPO|nr:MFS multidrug transporter [Fusarium agapanthi]